MGVESKAQLDMEREEFDYRTQNIALQLEGLKQDSAAIQLHLELMDRELERAGKSTAHFRYLR